MLSSDRYCPDPLPCIADLQCKATSAEGSRALLGGIPEAILSTHPGRGTAAPANENLGPLVPMIMEAAAG